MHAGRKWEVDNKYFKLLVGVPLLAALRIAFARDFKQLQASQHLRWQSIDLADINNKLETMHNDF